MIIIKKWYFISVIFCKQPITKVSEDEVGFIGDLVVGKRHADETIYRRTMEVKNYDPVVSFYSVDFSVKSGEYFCSFFHGKKHFQLFIPDSTSGTIERDVTMYIDNNN